MTPAMHRGAARRWASGTIAGFAPQWRPSPFPCATPVQDATAINEVARVRN